MKFIRVIRRSNLGSWSNLELTRMGTEGVTWCSLPSVDVRWSPIASRLPARLASEAILIKSIGSDN